MRQKEQSKNQTYSNSKQVEFDGFKNKDILTKIKQILGKE